MPPTLVAAIFPQLAAQRSAQLELDAIVPGQFAREDDNPLLDPLFFQEWLAAKHQHLKVDHSYGGYGEDRSNLWRGHYMIPNDPIHLGLDVNVPAGTIVHSPVQGRVVHDWQDPDQKGGWGGRLVIEIDPNHFLIVAHLDPKSLAIKWDIRQGDPLGVVGDHHNNGGWYPHVHIQQVINRHWNRIDGYGTVKDLELCPNPMDLLP